MRRWLLVAGAVAVLVFAAVAVSRIGRADRPRSTKAGADARALAAAVSQYREHMGALPAELAQLTRSSRNARGETAGAFLSAIPTPPTGWSPAYSYTPAADGTFTISAAGDGTAVRVP
jgi:hypothetical protein